MHVYNVGKIKYIYMLLQSSSISMQATAITLKPQRKLWGNFM